MLRRHVDRVVVMVLQSSEGIGRLARLGWVSGEDCRYGGSARNRVYAATKWGVNGWSESLRRELLPDVRVSLIEPDAVATELPNHITHANTKQGGEQFYSQVDATAEDIADVIAFVVGRPRRLAIHEVLRRPAGHEL